MTNSTIKFLIFNKILKTHLFDYQANILVMFLQSKSLAQIDVNTVEIKLIFKCTLIIYRQ